MSVRHLIIDVDLCEDCGNCLLACKDEHVGNDWPGYSAAQPRHGHRWIDVRARERGEFPLVDVINLPHTCVHCEHPSCVRVGKGAVHKRLDGIVLIDPLLARGRRDIVASCPYGSIWWNEEASLPQKCTLCAHLLDDGWAEPRCVQACPTGALRVVQVDSKELAELVSHEGLESLHPEYGTAPSVLYRDLSRAQSERLCGTVTCESAGREECARGARVELHRADVPVTQAICDAFGDFVFDGLPEVGDECCLRISFAGHESAEVPVPAPGWVSVRTIALRRAEVGA